MITIMRNATLSHRLALLTALLLAGCASKQNGGSSSGGLGDSANFGVVGRIEDQAAVSSVRTFYVAPNTQTAMSNSFIVGSPLSQVFADRIATRFTKQGLQQAPQDMADAIVTFTVQNPAPASAANPGNAQGLAYADQLLNEAQGMETKDNFLDNSRLDFRIKMNTTKSPHLVWQGSIAGVLPANEGNRGRLLDTLSAVDRLIDQYPKVGN